MSCSPTDNPFGNCICSCEDARDRLGPKSGTKIARRRSRRGASQPRSRHEKRRIFGRAYRSPSNGSARAFEIAVLTTARLLLGGAARWNAQRRHYRLGKRASGQLQLQVERSLADNAQDIRRRKALVTQLRQYPVDKAIGRLRNCRRHGRARLERSGLNGVDQAMLG